MKPSDADQFAGGPSSTATEEDEACYYQIVNLQRALKREGENDNAHNILEADTHFPFPSPAKEGEEKVERDPFPFTFGEGFGKRRGLILFLQH
ncbi:hypothetical protein CDAR_459391 [Caerostris darwini]|uniref:Uncharacterized protein n=1 Tax=Caerostris darwini TaxID=1538125 RepID=A0AAV4UDF4_9ARAC|nr:hypothetical protein CDAR_459391 [Caerostris darwini]